MWLWCARLTPYCHYCPSGTVSVPRSQGEYLVSMDIEHFPSLSSEEFAEACHYLDRQYCGATLGPLRKEWKLRVCTALDMMFSFDAAYTTYIQIVCPLQEKHDQDDLTSQLATFSLSPERNGDMLPVADRDMMESEDADEAVLDRPVSGPSFGHVTYEIHLHPTYRIPCLWFSLHGLPPDEPAFNIDTVFRRLVPDEYKAILRGFGGIGGISADHHPITGVPSFFVHPCLLGDAISGFDCSRENYLMIWLGLVGGSVGLWVPKEMAI